MVAYKGAHDDILRLSIALLVDLDHEMIAASASARQTNIEHAWKTALQMLQQRSLPREFAKRTFRLADLRQNTALDDDFRVRWNAHGIGLAFHHFDRMPKESARNLHFIVIKRRDGLRCKQAYRMDPYNQGYFERVAGLFCHAK